ncbi:MAG: hypothetical protein AB7G93_15340 [Bdellovibrionales bacterium]
MLTIKPLRRSWTSGHECGPTSRPPLQAQGAGHTIRGAYFRTVPAGGGEASYILGIAHAPVDFEEFPGDIKKQIANSKSVSVERVMAEDGLYDYAKDPFSAMAKMAVFGGTPVGEWTRQKLIEYGIPSGVAARLSDRDCGALEVLSQPQLRH